MSQKQKHNGVGDNVAGDKKVSINLKSPKLSFEFDVGNQKLKTIENSSSWEREIVDRFTKEIINTTQSKYHLLGLPGTGKSTSIRQVLEKISISKGIETFLIPSKSLSNKDLHQLINAVSEGESKKIIALDDFRHDFDVLNNNNKNTKICLIHQDAVNKSDFLFKGNGLYVKPLNTFEFKSFYISKLPFLNSLVPLPILKYIEKASAGLPELSNLYLDFFDAKGRLPKLHEVEKFLSKHFRNRIKDTFFYQINSNHTEFLLSLLITQKRISELFTNDLNNDATHLKKIGIDTFIKSKFIRNLVLESSDVSEFEFLKKHISYYKDNIKSDNNILIWTADYDVRPVKKGYKIIDLASSIFKNNSNRLDINYSFVNGKETTYDYVLREGDFVKLSLGKEMTNDLRNQLHEIVEPEFKKYFIRSKRGKKYSKKRKEIREIIGQADKLCKSGYFDDAEKLYLQTIYSNKKIDANWGRVRLANLHRIKGDLESAKQHCHAILRTTPNPFAYNCLGICLFWEGDINAGLKLFDKSIALKKSKRIFAIYRNAALWKSRSLLHLRDFGNAEISFDKIKRNRSGHQKSSRPSFQESLINWFLLKLNPEYKERSERLAFTLRTQIENNHFDIRDYPLISLFSDLCGGIKNVDKLLEKSKPILNELEGLRYDLCMWQKFVDFEFDFEISENVKTLIYSPVA